MKERQKQSEAAWGKVRGACRALPLLALRALDVLIPPRAISRSLRTLTAEDLFLRSECAGETPNNCRAIFAYRDPLVRRLIWEMKYRLSSKAIALAADCFVAALAEEIAERTLFDALSRPFLVSIPASPTRALERGGDPLFLLTARTATRLSGLCAHMPHALYKIRDTEPQTTIVHRAERLRNVVGSFSVHKNSEIHGRDVIVLDDVTTTGATFAEARRALRAAGARTVMCVAFAH